MAAPQQPLSIVIASRTGGPGLRRTLDAVLAIADSSCEVLVVDSAASDPIATVGSHTPATVRRLHCDPPRSLPELRAAGLVAARGTIVALLGEDCTPSADWCTAVRRAHERSGAAAIGGAVQKGGRDRLLDWAVFFCEYGRYSLPFVSEHTSDLPAQNVSYSRSAVGALEDVFAPDAWEPLWHWHLARRGFALVRSPSVVVTLEKDYALGSFLRQRFHYARSFAAARLAHASVARKLAYAVATPALPALLVSRMFAEIWPKKIYRGRLLRSLPYLVAFTTVWSWGECIGALMGAGNSALAVD